MIRDDVKIKIEYGIDNIKPSGKENLVAFCGGEVI